MKRTNKRKIDCLFLHVPKFLRKGYKIIKLPHGFFSMSSYLKGRGHKVEIVNIGNEVSLNPRFSIKEYLSGMDVPLIAVSLQWHYQTFHTLKLLRHIRSIKPNSFILLGGFTASYFYKELLENYRFIDGVIRGDAEIPVHKLLKVLKGKGKGKGKDFYDVPNMAWRNKSSHIVVNDLSYVVSEKENNGFIYTDFSSIRNCESYLDVISDTVIDGVDVRTFAVPLGRGCNVNCAYCAGSYMSQKSYYSRSGFIRRSIDKVLGDMSMLRDKYNVKLFHFSFDPTPSDQSYFVKLFRRIRRAKFKTYLEFECWGMPSKGFIDEFKKTFLPGSIISLFPDTGSDAYRKLIKGHYFSNRDFYRTLDYLEDNNISSMLYFIKNVNGQPRSSVDATKAMIETVKSRYSYVTRIFYNDMLHEPASPMYLNPEKYGIKNIVVGVKGYYRRHATKSEAFDRLLKA